MRIFDAYNSINGQKSMKQPTKEDLLKAIKKAKEHKEAARKKTAQEWKKEGIKGNVVLL